MKNYYIYYQPVFSKNKKALVGYNTAVTQKADDPAYRSYSRISVELESEEKTEAEFKRVERMLYFFRLDGVSFVEAAPLRILEYVRGIPRRIPVRDEGWLDSLENWRVDCRGDRC